MPIYDFECPLCGPVEDVWAHIQETRKPHDECGRKMKRVLSPVRLNCDIEPYLEENAGHEPVYIKSRRHRTQVLKERGLVIR